MTVRTSVLFLGHGTRNPAGQAEFLQLKDLAMAHARHILEAKSEALPVSVHHAYLELARPDVVEGFARVERTEPADCCWFRFFCLPLGT
ncbi:hypothetical protein GCM10025857_19970 [Alicyclobacillus contaminans]|nr:hypothetical protein GCM10025857_19970 [Alicyclobacillus contaminans]